MYPIHTLRKRSMASDSSLQYKYYKLKSILSSVEYSSKCYVKEFLLIKHNTTLPPTHKCTFLLF